MRLVPALALTMAISAFGASIAPAQSASKSKSPGEIAAESRVLAEKSAKCRSEAKVKKLHFGKRRAFLRECMKG